MSFDLVVHYNEFKNSTSRLYTSISMSYSRGPSIYTSYYLPVKHNLQGCRQAARNWFKHLTTGLLAQGFTQSKIDSCLFLQHDSTLVVYMDDCLTFSKENKTSDQLIQSLSKIFLLQDEGDVSTFLGIQIKKDSTTKTIILPNQD